MNSIADEIDFSPKLLWNIIMPLMTEKRHKLFAVSSVKPGGAFSTIVGATDETTGLPLLHSVVLGNPCDACKNSDAPYMCTHTDNALADWKDPRRAARAAKVFKACGQVGALMVELYNMAGNASGAVFDRKYYAPILGACLPNLVDPIDVVYVGVDPASRGPCEFGIVAVGQTRGKNKYQIISLCAEDVMGVPERGDQIILRSLQAIKAHPRVSYNTPVIIIIEGMGGESMWLGPKFHDTARDLNMNTHIMREMKEGPDGQGFGVPKNAMVTEAMINCLSTAFAAGLVAVPADCASVSSQWALPPIDLQGQCSKLREQLGAFKANQDGKVNGKAGGLNDDLVVSFMMTIYWSQRFCRSQKPEYRAFMDLFGNLTEAWMIGAMCAFAAPNPKL